MLLDYIKLMQDAADLKEGYAAAQPFPHIVLDNFLPERALQMLLDGFPPPDSVIWKGVDSEHTKSKQDTRYAVGNTKDILFGRARPVFMELTSGSFAGFLNQLTGIEYLLPDPYYVEGGFHVVGNGGKLDPHADFSHHKFTGLERRVNLLLYLNPDWTHGGSLTLYDKNCRPQVDIEPILNRCVIFSTSATSFHGHPIPMTLPDGVKRRSLALYYYKLSADRPRHKIIFPEFAPLAAAGNRAIGE